MHQHLGVGEDPTTPRRQGLACEPQLVEENLAWFHVGGGVIPSFGNHIFPAPESKSFQTGKCRASRGPGHRQAKGDNVPTRRRIEQMQVEA
jgi:hypothetical protein